MNTVSAQYEYQNKIRKINLEAEDDLLEKGQSLTVSNTIYLFNYFRKMNYNYYIQN